MPKDVQNYSVIAHSEIPGKSKEFRIELLTLLDSISSESSRVPWYLWPWHVFTSVIAFPWSWKTKESAHL